MKSKETPEKLYLSDIQRYFDDKDVTASTIRYADDDIEYIRKDAFIKKASEWLKENKDHPFIGCEDPCLSGYLTDEFIEAFKKAMEK